MFSGYSRAYSHVNSAVVAACTRSVLDQARPNPVMNRIGEHDAPFFPKEGLVIYSFLERERESIFFKVVTPSKSTLL